MEVDAGHSPWSVNSGVSSEVDDEEDGDNLTSAAKKLLGPLGRVLLGFSSQSARCWAIDFLETSTVCYPPKASGNMVEDAGKTW